MAYNSEQARTIKIHRTTAQTTVTTSAWTDCDSFTEISSETTGVVAELNADNKTIDILQDGYYIFGGCVHIQNNTAGIFSGLTVLTRLEKNGTTELRCSQRGYTIDIAAGGEDVLSYNGTVYLESGDSVRLQYWTDESDVEFDSNSNFSNQVAYTFWLTKIGD